MAETPPLSGPLAGASGRELRELQQFLLYLGSALTAAGEAVNHVEEHLRRVAAAYGAPRARVSVLPTYLVVALEPGRPATLEPTRQLRGVLRLDQTAALFEVLKAAQRGEQSPDEGSHRIRQMAADHPLRPVQWGLGSSGWAAMGLAQGSTGDLTPGVGRGGAAPETCAP